MTVEVEWESLLAEHGPAVWRTAYRLLGHDADAQDCYQETFLAAWRYAGRRGVDDWGPFLARLATRRAVDMLRRRIRRRGRVGALEGAPEPVDGAAGPVQEARARELLGRVRAGLVRLPAKQAEVAWLSGVEGLSHAEIGAQMRITPNEVRVLLHRARARLAQFL